MAKKRKHEQNGKTSMPRDQMPLEGSLDISPSSICDVLIQFKDSIQVRVNTDEWLQKLEEMVKKLEEKVKKLEEKVKKLKEKVKKNKSKVEDLKKELIDKVKEELKLEHQEEMQKEGCTKVHHYNASPSLRSQPHQSQTTKFRLAIKSTVNPIVYKGKPIRTDDSDHIEVVLYDGGNPIAPDHHLASAAVELVVVDEEFSLLTQEFWSKDDFEQKIMKPRQGNNPKLVKNGRFKLAGGRYRHKGAVITENSLRKDVKLGVMIVEDTKERVLEGVSDIFRVQEAKTEKDRGKRTTDDDTAENLPSYTGQSFSHVTNKNGLGQPYSLPTTRPMCNFLNMQNPSHIAYAQTARHDPVGPLPVNGLPQQGTTQLENRGQGQQYSLPKTGPTCNFLNTQNPSQIAYAHTAGNCPVGLLPVDRLQQQHATQQGITQPENYGQGWQHSFLPEQHNFAVMPNPSQRTYAHAAGHGPGGQLPVDHLQQQNTTQQGATQLENHGNGLDGQLPVDQLQQKNTTQHGATQLEIHGSSTQIWTGPPAGDEFVDDLEYPNGSSMQSQPIRKRILQALSTRASAN